MRARGEQVSGNREMVPYFEAPQGISNPGKIHFCDWHGISMMFKLWPCHSRVARQSLSNLFALPNQTQNFDSDVALLPYFKN